MSAAPKIGIVDRWVDRALSIWRPEGLALRHHLRRLEWDDGYRDAHNQSLKYRNASAEWNSTPWLGAGASADAVISASIETLRNRCRELARDDAIGSAILRTFTNEVIGVGMFPQARTGDDTVDATLEELWDERSEHLFPAEGLSFNDGQRLIYRRVLEDGDVVVKKTVATLREPLWFEVIEGDRLATPSALQSDSQMRDGVRRDAAGRPVSYCILRSAPGEVMIGPKQGDYSEYRKEVICHARMIERAGQTRGVPLLHAVLQDLRDWDLLTVAALKRMQISALMALVLESPQPMEGMFQSDQQNYGHWLKEPLRPGKILKTYPGEKPYTVSPNFPPPELFPFVKMIAQRVGSSIGICWQSVLHEFGETNYSSGRQNALQDRRTYETHQRWFIDNVLNWIWFAVMDDARARGDKRVIGLDDSKLMSVEWIPPRREWVDPAKEMQGLQLAIDAGLETKSGLCASRGLDWRETTLQRIQEEKFERDARNQAGLDASSDKGDASNAT